MRSLRIVVAALCGALGVATLLPMSVSAHTPMVLAPPPAPDAGNTTRIRVSPRETDLELHGPAPREIPVSLYAENLRERVTLTIPAEAAFISDDTMKALSRILRDKRTGRRHRIDRGIAVVLARVAEEFPGREIVVVSGYRTSNGAPRSRHFSGRAVDFRIEGVPSHQIRDFVWQSLEQVGVGHYHSQGFIHVDIRRREPKIGWNQGRPGQPYRYNPRWTLGTI